MSWSTGRFILGTLEHRGPLTVAELADLGDVSQSTIRNRLSEMIAAGTARYALTDLATVPAVHRLKTWTPYYSAVVVGFKPFEIRRADRDFKLHDRLRLVEVTAPPALLPTGREADAEITFILPGGQFGIEPGYVALGLRNVTEVST